MQPTTNVFYRSAVTEDGLLVLWDGESGRFLCALPAIKGGRYVIAAVPRSSRKRGKTMAGQGVPWKRSPLGLGVVLHEDDTASHQLLSDGEGMPSDAVIRQAHPGIVVELLARHGRWKEVEETLLLQAGAMEWVLGGLAAQTTSMADPAAEALQTLRDVALVVPLRAAGRAAVSEIDAEQKHTS